MPAACLDEPDFLMTECTRRKQTCSKTRRESAQGRGDWNPRELTFGDSQATVETVSVTCPVGAGAQVQVTMDAASDATSETKKCQQPTAAY